MPRRKCQMDHVCHKNKCCQSTSPKQYKNNDFSAKNNNPGNTVSIVTRKKEEDVAMEPVLPRLFFLSKKSVFLHYFGELLWPHLFL